MDWENQKMLENLFNKHQTIPLIKQHYEEALKNIKMRSLEFTLHAMAHLALANKMPIQALVGIMKCRFSSTRQQIADWCVELAEQDFVDYDPVTGMFVCKYPLPERIWNLIRQYRYMPPMIVPPLEMRNNRDSGYITYDRDHSLILQDNHHDGDICLDHINRMNQVGLCLDERIVKLIRNNWKNLDKKKDDEDFQDWQDRIDAFKKYEIDSMWVLALMVEMGNEFWLTHKYDKRGRTYCMGYHATYQGNSWNKSMIQLQHKELIEG